MKPHEALEGVELDRGWKVTQRIVKPEGVSGGYFSCGYFAEKEDGTRGYLKALDFFSRLSDSKDPARDLEPMIKAFNFERDLLEQCRSRRLSRIVTALDDGAVTLPGYSGASTVQYLIFELAEADLRKLMVVTGELDIAWALRSLHHITLGLDQLHRIDIGT